jgi:hypothetical protein
MTSSPAERAVPGPRDVLDLACDEITEAVGKSPAAVPWIAYSARAHVAGRAGFPAEIREVGCRYRWLSQAAAWSGIQLSAAVSFCGSSESIPMRSP